MKKTQTPQQPITPSRQRAAQTTPAHLHGCRAGADPPSSCPVQALATEAIPRNEVTFLPSIYLNCSSFSECTARCESLATELPSDLPVVVNEAMLLSFPSCCFLCKQICKIYKSLAEFHAILQQFVDLVLSGFLHFLYAVTLDETT